MKKGLTLLILAISCAVSSLAQTLKFSQVLLINTSTAVPANTVWKITSVLGSDPLTSSFTTSSSTTTQRIVVNGADVFVAAWDYRFHGSSSTSATSTKTATSAFGNVTQLPIWLPAGTTLDKGLNSSGVSVIEFTVVP